MSTTPSLLRARTSRLIAVVCTVAVATFGLGASYITAPAPVASAASPGIAMMGPSTLTAQQIARWFASTKRVAAVPMTVEQLAAIYLFEGGAENVRGDIAFAQSVVETGYFGFAGSIVRPGNYNYAGMGACDSCSGGVQFPNTEIGVRAQIQHLKNYADIRSRASGLHFPPVPEWYARTTHNPVTAARNFDVFFAKGRAPNWNQMGNGNWATAPNYAATVLGVYNKMLTFNGLRGVCPPDGLSVGANAATQCPVALQSPGRAVAANGAGRYVLTGTGQVKPASGAPFFGNPTFGWDIARDIAVMPDGQGYIVLDGYGGLHKFGTAATGVMGSLAAASWPGWDIARSLAIMPDGKGLMMIDGWGGQHPAGTARAFSGGPYWRGWDIARSIRITASGTGAYLLDGFGYAWPLGTAPRLGSPTFGWDIARAIALMPDGNGYAILDGFGAIHNFGSAPPASNALYVPADRFRGIARVGSQYGLVRNDGTSSTS